MEQEIKSLKSGSGICTLDHCITLDGKMKEERKRKEGGREGRKEGMKGRKRNKKKGKVLNPHK
jgi:hypothetical protein